MDEREALEEELQRTRLAYQSAIALARWQGEFLGRAAHELRSPLSSLISLHQLILTDLCENPEEEREFIGRAHQAAGKLLGMLDEMIAISKLESGRITLDRQPVSLEGILEDLERLTRLLGANRNVRLEIVILSPGISLWTDYRHLCHALVLLVDAAIASSARTTLRLIGDSPDGETGMISIEIPGFLNLEEERTSVAADADLAVIDRWNQSLSLSPSLKLEIARRIIQYLDGRFSYGEIALGDGEKTITRIDCSLPRSLVLAEIPTDSD
jgi:K+-sensing histidine kinase KdpD